MELRLGIVILTILLICKETLQASSTTEKMSTITATTTMKPPERPFTRPFPLCVSKYMFEEYKANLPAGIKFEKFLTPKYFGKTIKLKNIGVTFNGGTSPDYPNGLVDSINYYRILADCKNGKNEEDYRDKCRAMRQWAHIHIKTKRKVVGLIVQANTEPFFLPYGKFDLEFGCLDCKDGINVTDAKEGDALTLRGRAAVIPCDRRSHLHIRHPNVYAFAVETTAQARSSFHINYSWMDVTCRHVSALQFMLFVIEDWSEDVGKVERFFSYKIDQRETDSVDGMPYPYHVSWHDTMKCHIENSDLPNAENTVGGIDGVKKRKQLPFIPAPNGGLWRQQIILDPDYDACIRAHNSTTEYSPKHAQDKILDKDRYISRRMCRNIVQTKCNYSLPINDPSKGIGSESGGYGSGCKKCTDDDNEYTRQALKKMIRRDYMLQRIHGITAIMGLIAINIINIHISRYFKEAGGCCMLVGWWLWTHLALSYLSLGAVWVSISLVTSSERPEYPDVEFVYLKKMHSARTCILVLHKYVGWFAIFWYHVDFLFGVYRPVSSALRLGCICVHACSGYFAAIIAMAAVFYSTACWDLIIFTATMLGFSLIPWIFGFVLQILMDSKKKLNPGRKYFPVIEAVQVQPQLPMKVVRFVILGFLVVLTLACFCLVIFQGGRYKGWFIKNPCANCLLKIDEYIIKTTGKIAQTEAAFDTFKCLKKENEQLQKTTEATFESIIKSCMKKMPTITNDVIEVKENITDTGNYLD